MDLIALDKKYIQSVQKLLGLSNYQILNLIWSFIFMVGVVASLILH